MNEISNKRNYMLTLFSKSGGMILQALLGLVSVPISLKYWGAETYGIIAVINSVIVYLSVSNIGLGSATAVLMGKNKSIDKKIKILKKSFVILSILSVAILLVFLGVNYFYKDWINFLGKIPQYLKNDAYKSCLILSIFYFINQPLSILNTIYYGFNKQYIYDTFGIVFGIINFMRLLAVVYFKLNMIQFVLLMGIFDLCYYLIRGIYGYFFILKKEMIKNINEEVNKNEKELENMYIIKTGFNFFLMGFAAMIAWNSDNIVISNFLGVEFVPKFAVTYKLFALLFTILGILNASFLPILSKEIGEKNWSWISEKYKFLSIINLTLGGLFFLGGVTYFKDVILLWVGENNYPGFFVILFLGGYSYLLSITGLNSGVMNTFNYIKGVHFIYWIEATVNVSLSIVLCKYFSLGGIAMGTFIGGLVPYITLPIILNKKSNGKLPYYHKIYIHHFFLILVPSIVINTAGNLLITNIFVRWIFDSLICIVYLFFCFKMFNEEERDLVVSKVKEFIRKGGNKFGKVTNNRDSNI